MTDRLLRAGVLAVGLLLLAVVVPVGGSAGHSTRPAAVESAARPATVVGGTVDSVAFDLNITANPIVSVGFGLSANFTLPSGTIDVGTTLPGTAGLASAGDARLWISVLGASRSLPFSGLGRDGPITIPGIEYTYDGVPFGVSVTTSAVLSGNFSVGGPNPIGPTPESWTAPANSTISIDASSATPGHSIPVSFSTLAYRLEVSVNATGTVPVLGELTIPLLPLTDLGSITGTPGSVEANYTVTALPAVGSFVATPNPVVQGDPVTLTVGVTGGAPPVAIAFVGLPPGCLPTGGDSITCTPSLSGSFGVNVNATDAQGKFASDSLTLVVQAPGSPGGTGSTASPFGGTVALVLIVGAIAVAALLVGLFFGRRRAK
jgi:hypothetical protein